MGSGRRFATPGQSMRSVYAFVRSILLAGEDANDPARVPAWILSYVVEDRAEIGRQLVQSIVQCRIVEQPARSAISVGKCLHQRITRLRHAHDPRVERIIAQQLADGSVLVVERD